MQVVVAEDDHLRDSGEVEARYMGFGQGIGLVDSLDGEGKIELEAGTAAVGTGELGGD
jgi:hypothetical protein